MNFEIGQGQQELLEPHANINFVGTRRLIDDDNGIESNDGGYKIQSHSQIIRDDKRHLRNGAAHQINMLQQYQNQTGRSQHQQYSNSFAL